MRTNLALQQQDIDAVSVTAGILLDSPVLSVEPVLGGGNNRVYRLQTANGPVALKFYPRHREDVRDRQGAEVSALKFLSRYSVSQVPEVLAESREAGCAALTWIDGGRVSEPAARDVDDALRLLAELRALSEAHGADVLRDASAATFSGAQVVAQIEARLARIRGVADQHPELNQFLRKQLSPALQKVGAWARRAYAQAGIDFELELGPNERTLSPSDFGFHNTLRRTNGRLAFVDFEYFGWDDPAKLVSDFLLHPGMTLTPTLKQRFLAGASAVFGDRHGDFTARFMALYPLYGLCWCLIMLNEFFPERWLRRAVNFKGETKEAVQARQLARSRVLLQKMVETYESGPDLG